MNDYVFYADSKVNYVANICKDPQNSVLICNELINAQKNAKTFNENFISDLNTLEAEAPLAVVILKALTNDDLMQQLELVDQIALDKAFLRIISDELSLETIGAIRECLQSERIKLTNAHFIVLKKHATEIKPVFEHIKHNEYGNMIYEGLDILLKKSNSYLEYVFLEMPESLWPLHQSEEE